MRSDSSSRDPLPSHASKPAVPAAVWALGLVSLFMDVSSEMIHGLLPVFLVTGLGASASVVGLIEGVGEATASITKVFSGAISDALGKRKLLALVGYGLGAASKPLFAVAPSAGWVLSARFTDRVGKGIRGAPRDALVADVTPEALRGRAYGLRQALDSVGAFAGPFLAIWLMWATSGDFRAVFWIAVIPGALAVAVLAVGVRETDPPRTAGPRLRRSDVRSFARAYWGAVVVGIVLTLARFSEAFLILRAEALGLPLALAPLVLVAMNVVYALSAYPMGALSDAVDRRTVLAGGFGILAAAHLALAAAPALWVVFVGAGLWGLQMGMTQGLLAVLVADAAPQPLRGTAFGVFHLASGIALLLANLMAGFLWQVVGAPATFLAGAVLTAIGLLGVLAAGRSRRG